MHETHLKYGISGEQNRIATSYYSTSSLLSPSGYLSQELQSILDDIFMKHSNGLLFINKIYLIQYYKKCYPALIKKERKNIKR